MRLPPDPDFDQRVDAAAKILREQMRDWRIDKADYDSAKLADHEDLREMLVSAFKSMVEDFRQAHLAEPPITRDFFREVREMSSFLQARINIAKHPVLAAYGDDNFEVATFLLGSVIKSASDFAKAEGLPEAGINHVIVDRIDIGTVREGYKGK